MKSKIINLFKNSIYKENSGEKYSELLQQFIATFSDDLSDMEYFEDIIDFAIIAWNFGNMRVIVPEHEYEGIMFMAEKDGLDVALINKMTAYKAANFREYSNFIMDFEVDETDKDLVLTLTTQEEENYFATMAEEMDMDESHREYEEDYINRTAILVKPLQPFIDWCSNLYSKELDETNFLNELKETKTYLISEDIEDVDAWLKKKFDRLFVYELEAWHTNKKEWPQRRNYKMFNQWFQVDISRMVFDVEKEPVSKI